jgi:hypothetical protein
MPKQIHDVGVPDVPEFLEQIVASDAHLWACRMSADMMHLNESDLYDAVEGIICAADFIEKTDNPATVHPIRPPNGSAQTASVGTTGNFARGERRLGGRRRPELQPEAGVFDPVPVATCTCRRPSAARCWPMRCGPSRRLGASSSSDTT